jgi:hypothetical protein
MLKQKFVCTVVTDDLKKLREAFETANKLRANKQQLKRPLDLRHQSLFEREQTCLTT